MLSISKLNPMARAIGTMGVVAGLVGAVTFAQVNASPVSLTNNTLDAATASLAVGLTANCTDGAASQQGMSFTNLVPGSTSAAFPFCIANTGGANGTPLTLSAVIPGTLSGTLDPSTVTLHFTCGVGGVDNSGAVDLTTTVAALNATPQPFGTLNNTTNNVDTCDVTATLASGATPASGASITPFPISFSGTAGS